MSQAMQTQTIVFGDAPFVATFQMEEQEDVEERGKGWVGILAIEGHPTSDKRFLIPGEIGQRDLPLPIAPSHEKQAETETVGRIEIIEHIPAAEFDKEGWDLPENISDKAVVIWGEGTFDGSEESEDAIRAMENGVGISLDLPMDRQAIIDANTLEEVDPRDLEDEDLMGLMFGIVPDGYLRGIAGKIGGASLASIAAFEETRIKIVEDHALVASAVRIQGSETLTASAAGLAPLKPPSSWFYMEELDEPTPLTVTDEGQVFGHLALWNQCHTAFASCERPPHSDSGYAFFHVGQIETAEGDLVNVGRVTVGNQGAAKGGHASLVLGRQGAMEHYDKSGCVAAFVRAKDGKHGIWLSGAVRSDAPAERIRDMRANPPSGDWREYELVAVLSVPVPGFPIPRAEAILVASGADEEIPVLIATGYAPDRVDILTYRRRMRDLRNRALEALAVDPFYWEPGGSRWESFKDYPAAERRRMAKDGRALSDGSFPIKDCADAEDAIRSQGRADPSKRNRVRAHIRRRVRSLGCSGSIFEPYK